MGPVDKVGPLYTVAPVHAMDPLLYSGSRIYSGSIVIQWVQYIQWVHYIQCAFCYTVGPVYDGFDSPSITPKEKFTHTKKNWNVVYFFNLQMCKKER